MTKRTGFYLLAAAIAGLFALQAADYKGPHAERDEKDILQLEAEWTKAIQSRDTATLDRLLASEYTMVDSSGKTVTKAQEIATYGSAELKVDSFATSGHKITIYIGGAIVTGTATIKGKHGKEDISGQYRFVDVLERRKEGWQAVYSQITKVETEKDKKKKQTK
jgi:ketosteroid isomerase-like protein